MRIKNCPLCNSVAGRWKAGPAKGRLTCWNNDCLLVDNHFDEETWNAFPRRDPLAKQKERVVKAAIDKVENAHGYEVGDLAIAIEKLKKATLRVHHAKK